MIESQTVDIGKWLPDQPDLNNSCPTVINAIPQARSFGAVNSLIPVAAALPSKPLRGFIAVSTAGNTFNMAGDATDLYSLGTGSGVYSVASKVGGYAVSSWQFTRFGDRILASSLEEPMQYLDMDVTTLFADQPGAPPKARAIAVVRDFVVVGNIDDGTVRPSRVQWSGFNNSEKWDVNAGTQSDFQDLFGNGGEIQRIVPGEYGVIFQKNSIWRMDYAGPPTIFRFDEVEPGRGTLAPNSVCWQGSSIYYLGHDGFYLFDGLRSTPIGAEKIDRYILKNIDTSRLGEVYGAVDRRNNLVVWSYPLLTGEYEVLFYNWVTGDWGQSNEQIVALSEYADEGFTLDQLDNILADIDSQSIVADDPALQGGFITVAAFTTGFKLSVFAGSPLDSEIVTGETGIPQGQRVYVQSARPIVEGSGDYYIALGGRANQAANLVFGDAKRQSYNGECQFHNNLKFTRFKLVLSGGFKHAYGVEVFYKKAGRL